MSYKTYNRYRNTHSLSREHSLSNKRERVFVNSSMNNRSNIFGSSSTTGFANSRDLPMYTRSQSNTTNIPNMRNIYGHSSSQSQFPKPATISVLYINCFLQHETQVAITSDGTRYSISKQNSSQHNRILDHLNPDDYHILTSWTYGRDYYWQLTNGTLVVYWDIQQSNDSKSEKSNPTDDLANPNNISIKLGNSSYSNNTANDMSNQRSSKATVTDMMNEHRRILHENQRLAEHKTRRGVKTSGRMSGDTTMEHFSDDIGRKRNSFATGKFIYEDTDHTEHTYSDCNHRSSSPHEYFPEEYQSSPPNISIPTGIKLHQSFKRPASPEPMYHSEFTYEAKKVPKENHRQKPSGFKIRPFRRDSTDIDSDTTLDSHIMKTGRDYVPSYQPKVSSVEKVPDTNSAVVTSNEDEYDPVIVPKQNQFQKQQSVISSVSSISSPAPGFLLRSISNVTDRSSIQDTILDRYDFDNEEVLAAVEAILREKKLTGQTSISAPERLSEMLHEKAKNVTEPLKHDVTVKDTNIFTKEFTRGLNDVNAPSWMFSFSIWLLSLLSSVAEYCPGFKLLVISNINFYHLAVNIHWIYLRVLMRDGMLQFEDFWKCEIKGIDRVIIISCYVASWYVTEIVIGFYILTINIFSGFMGCNIQSRQLNRIEYPNVEDVNAENVSFLDCFKCISEVKRQVNGTVWYLIKLYTLLFVVAMGCNIIFPFVMTVSSVGPQSVTARVGIIHAGVLLSLLKLSMFKILYGSDSTKDVGSTIICVISIIMYAGVGSKIYNYIGTMF